MPISHNTMYKTFFNRFEIIYAVYYFNSKLTDDTLKLQQLIGIIIILKKNRDGYSDEQRVISQSRFPRGETVYRHSLDNVIIHASNYSPIVGVLCRNLFPIFYLSRVLDNFIFVDMLEIVSCLP